MTWTLKEDGAGAALRLAGSLWLFWHVHGYLNEGRGWLERAVDEARGDDVPDAVRAKALHRLGNLVISLGEYDAARDHYEKSLALWQSLGDRRGVADALNGLGLVATA